jgi:poly-gamma-glutamate synthesis protein (capsule biosynthesis protein)
MGIVGIILICWIATGCSPQSSNPEPLLITSSQNQKTNTPFQPIPSTPAESNEVLTEAQPATSVNRPKTPTNTVTPDVVPGLWVAPYIPKVLSESFAVPAGFGMAENPENALVRFELSKGEPEINWVYALVAPFFTITDGISSEGLIRVWKGESGLGSAGLPLLVDEATLEVITALWGAPSPGSVKVTPSEDIVEVAWNQQSSWAIIPFEDLEPRWKVLEVDGKSPLRKDFNPDGYVLSINYSLEGDTDLVEKILLSSGYEQDGVVLTNWEATKLTTLVMTGVTAMVRCTANTMERKGLTYPAEDIGNWLREADLTHISNEIPFLPGCPFPNCTQPDLRFCSDPSYISLLEDVGADIVELTGDHFADYGPDAMRYTLQLYQDKDWIYYGGGENLDDARQARIIEHNGNQIAIIGCNAKGGGYATASDTNPGAVACDFNWMHDEITRLSEAGYNVIATFQHIEYYTYAPQPKQLEDYRGMATAGAVIVSGSQAHQPQGFEVSGDAFIHYGLGNLFFDQFNQPVCPNLACNDAFIDRHVFYDGRYIGTELLTITFVDFAKPRQMTGEERIQLLTKAFEASVH